MMASATWLDLFIPEDLLQDGSANRTTATKGCYERFYLKLDKKGMSNRIRKRIGFEAFSKQRRKISSSL